MLCGTIFFNEPPEVGVSEAKAANSLERSGAQSFGLVTA